MLKRDRIMKRLTTNPLRSLLCILLPLTLAGDLLAQPPTPTPAPTSQTGYNWYFGSGAQGIRFSRSDKSVTSIDNKATPFGQGGSAVASSDVNGDLFFYTDGATIYDATHQPMPNGSGLGGNSSGNQGVVVAKVPGQDNQYYVIVNSANGTTPGTVSYRIVDMSLYGNSAAPVPPLGAATSSSNILLDPPGPPVIPGLSSSAEAMIVVPQPGTDNFWLITHTNGTAQYTVTLFTPAGPQPSTTTSLGVITRPGNFAYHEDTNRIAVSPQEAGRNVEILDFDPATGVLSFNQSVANSAVATVAPGTAAIYDTEWSFSGNYLYISSQGGGGAPGNVMQYDLNNPLLTMPGVLPQPNTVFQSYGLQMGPDSVIYHLYQATNGGPFLLGSIADTDSVAANTIYTTQVFPGTNFNGRQFPSFAPSDTATITVSFTTNGTCANAPTGFFPTVSPGADSLRWSFGDGSGSGDWSPVYTYEQGGAYSATVTAYLNGQSATATQTVTITEFDTQISLVQDTTACSCELESPKAQPPPPRCGTFSVTAQVQGSGSATYQWFGPGGLIAGATSQTLQPDSAGYYYLVATVGSCATYAGVNIKEYGEEDQRANVWYFGNQAGIDFNPNIPNAPVPISNPVMNAPQGTSTISDRNGQVVLFTDGVRVWDRNFTMVSSTPPPGIGGSEQSAQAALIIPVPGDETLYYIFTTKDVYGDGTFELRYSLFDLKLNGGTGGMLEENQLLFVRSTERITGSEGWLIAHEYGNNSFRAYPISNLGIGNPVISAIGSDHSLASASAGKGYMKLGPQNRLAVALSDNGTNAVELFDFNQTTGVISNFRTVDLDPNGNVYGVEFSPGGNKIYATLRNGGSSQLVEIAIDTVSAEPILMTPPLSTSGDMGAIQIGPSGQVYVAVNGASSLGTIEPQEQQGIRSTYNPTGFALQGGTTSTLGLPNFIQNLADPVQGPAMSIAGQCLQDSTTFSAMPTDPIDRFQWQVRRGSNVIATSTQQEFQHLFTTPGLYDVSLRLTNRCGLDTLLTQQLEIFDAPPNPSGAAVLCTNSVVLDANPSNLPALSYAWSNGDTTETITVTQRGYYDVTVTNGAGCTTDGRVLVADNRPVVNLGDDVTICQNTPIAALDALNPGATYAWTINGVASGTSRTQRVNTSVAGPPTFEYEVTVTDPVTTCVTRDSVIFTINPLPVVTGPVTNDIACNATNGTIDLTINSPASALFTYSILGPSTSITGNDLTVGPIPQATGLAAGLYGVTVADQVTGCAITSTATVNTNTFTVAGIQSGTCDPIQIAATVSGSPPAAMVYRVVNVTDPTTSVTTGTSSLPTFTTSAAGGLPSNGQQYIVQVIDNSGSGCMSASDPITLQQDPTVPTDLVANVCPDANNTITIESTGGTGWLWTESGSTIVSGTQAQQIVQARPGTGTHTYNLRVTESGLCPLDTSITVTVEPRLTPALTDPGPSCGANVTLSVTPTGNYLYRWYINNVLQANLGGSEIPATPANNGNAFSVGVYSPVTGCTATSNEVVIVIDPALTVDLTSTTPCEGSPFTLTATPSRTATFQWSLNGSVISGQANATLLDQRAGLYEVIASAAACTATSSIDISLAPITPGSLTEQVFICPDPANPDPNTRTVTLRPGQFSSYDWQKDGVALGVTTPTLTVDEPGVYTVILENTFGCPSSDKTDVLVECDPVIVGPNAFRPSSNVVGLQGDMVNQAFHLYTFFIDDEGFEVYIFNRWGEMIYQSNERTFRWNGGYNNNLAQMSPNGTYTYLVRYKSSYRPEKGTMEKRGGVVLLR